jgi:hypothetical protein
MDWNQARIDVMNWITGFVERPHPLLNNWSPCPFARRARLEGQLDIRPGTTPWRDLFQADIEPYEVVMWIYDPQRIDAAELERAVDRLNEEHLTPRGLIALSDHPGSLEQVRGVTLNQGEWALVFLQSLPRLNEHAEMVARRGYYEGWPEDYLQALFQHRRDPRS